MKTIILVASLLLSITLVQAQLCNYPVETVGIVDSAANVEWYTPGPGYSPIYISYGIVSLEITESYKVKLGGFGVTLSAKHIIERWYEDPYHKVVFRDAQGVTYVVMYHSTDFCSHILVDFNNKTYLLVNPDKQRDYEKYLISARNF